MDNSIELIIEDKVAYLYLNRPTVFNSFNRAMAFNLQEKLDECAENESIRAIVLTGRGKAFSAGQDLKELVDPKNNFGLRTILEEHFNPIVDRIRKLKKPVIAAVNGVAAGAGANIALACDIVIANETASFIQAFSKIGLIPDSGGTFVLPRLIGFQKASALMMLGDKIGAVEAERMGMIYKYFSSETFETELKALATKLSNMPTKGLALAKEALNQSMNNTLEEQLDLEATLQIDASLSEDFKEGVNAFVEKRKANFIGK